MEKLGEARHSMMRLGKVRWRKVEWGGMRCHEARRGEVRYGLIRWVGQGEAGRAPSQAGVVGAKAVGPS